MRQILFNFGDPLVKSLGVCRNSAKNATSYNSFPDSCFAEQDGDIINIYIRERLLVELLRHKSKLPYDRDKVFLNNLKKANANWLEEDTSIVLKGILNYLSSI